MYLWKSKIKDRYQWALELHLFNNNSVGIEFKKLYYRDNPVTDPHPYEYIALNLTPHWNFGFNHIWYDGPHCSFSMGRLHLCWNIFNCRKCK